MYITREKNASNKCNECVIGVMCFLVDIPESNTYIYGFLNITSPQVATDTDRHPVVRATAGNRCDSASTDGSRRAQ